MCGVRWITASTLRFRISSRRFLGRKSPAAQIPADDPPGELDAEEIMDERANAFPGPEASWKPQLVGMIAHDGSNLGTDYHGRPYMLSSRPGNRTLLASVAGAATIFPRHHILRNLPPTRAGPEFSFIPGGLHPGSLHVRKDPQDSVDDKVDRDYVIERPGHGKNKNSSDKGENRLQWHHKTFPSPVGDSNL